MTSPKYTPKDWLRGDGFGRLDYFVSWREPEDDLEARELLAAQYQHEFACRIRAELRRRHTHLADFAEKAGSGYDRMTRVLRGVVIMRLEDIAAADLFLGQVSEFSREPEAYSNSKWRATYEANTKPGFRKEVVKLGREPAPRGRFSKRFAEGSR